jgi:3-dehydroquinate dehydratase-2
MKQTLLILNGPNQNLLGIREPEVYGTETLADIEEACRRHARRFDFAVDFRQSNHEGTLIDWIHEARERADGIVINPAGYTATSHAIMDALLAAGLPTVEVHLSNIFRRESFRHISQISRAATGVICGFGAQGYLLAIDVLAQRCEAPTSKK